MARHGLRINAVAPGFIETEMTEKMPFMVGWVSLVSPNDLSQCMFGG